jgi:hypothetical protein
MKTHRYRRDAPGHHSPSRAGHVALAIAAACMLALVAPAAWATTTIADPTGDFLSSFVGPHGADLDVTSASAGFDGVSFHLDATMAGAVGTTPNSLYVWGVDRGAGTQFLHNLHVADPLNQRDVGVGVFFDAFIALTPTGGGNGNGAVFLLNPAAQVVSMQSLAAGAVTINGDTISVVVPDAMLPGQGFNLTQYGFNIWPRITGISNNNQVSDFAPNESPLPAEGLPRRALFLSSAVPEPGAWSLMIIGFGGIGLTLRRRRPIQMA